MLDRQKNILYIERDFMVTEDYSDTYPSLCPVQKTTQKDIEKSNLRDP